jgi:FKBP-type peptidyl-prolyl cis-trans isomerase SlyD
LTSGVLFFARWPSQSLPVILEPVKRPGNPTAEPTALAGGGRLPIRSDPELFLRFGVYLDMKIENDKIVSFEYVLRDANGHVIESTEEGKPAEYLHGHSPLLPAMKSELEGKCAGDELKIEISAENGHGFWNEEKVQVVPRKDLPDLPDLKIGSLLATEVEGHKMPVMVIDLDDKSVTIDGNHPLAGKDLVYEIKIASVRDATAEELEHQHPHPPGGECG